MRLVPALSPLLLAQLSFAQVIAIYPAPTSVERGTTRQFSKYVAVSPDTATWSVNGIPGGNSTYGTITSNGLYAAPAVIPMDNVVKVRLTSTPQPSVFGESVVTITQPKPWLWSTYPSSFTTGTARSFSLNGSGFIPQSVVRVNGVPWPTTYVNGTTLKTMGDLPTAGTFQVTVAQPDPGALVSSAVNITVSTAPATPITVTVSPSSTSLALTASAQFTASVAGTSNTAVTWTASAGTITQAGLYIAPSTMPASPTVVVRATSAADTSKYGQASITLTSSGGGTGGGTPGNNGSDLTAGRFLEQAAFGPTPAEIANVKSQGINGWLDNQFAMPETVIPIPSQSGNVQSQTLNRLSTAPDQLRQKMAWALGQIIVISMNKNIYPNEYVPYLQILSRNAFGNYRTLLADISMSPQMGKYLDIANSMKAGVGSGANENYPRELMQLFTIGLYQLNQDGSQKLVNGQPVSTYTQNDVRQVANALTGWTYPTAPGGNMNMNNWENFSQPRMETRQANHDTTAKAFLGCNLPANQTVQQDMDGVLDCVFNHPNIAPFVATRLIRAIATSNPTPGYIQRVADVFVNNGAGVRGDLKAVLKAILTDAEARNDTATVNSGRLKDPVYFIVSFVRTMGGSFPATTQTPYMFVQMGQAINNPPSVFYYYSPMYRLPLNPSLYGPEFQIFTPTESVVEANMVYQMLTQPGSDPSIDIAPFTAVAGNTPQLLDLLDQRFFYGRMGTQIRGALATAIDASYDNTQRVQTAIYLAVLSGQYQTQY
ncbi:MAG: DUF1800 family protein [Acidobacteria bacterium]|nr:DUF1800 family protein [Acidobacteriota bacterium]